MGAHAKKTDDLWRELVALAANERGESSTGCSTSSRVPAVHISTA
jgi:hypothetical protein